MTSKLLKSKIEANNVKIFKVLKKIIVNRIICPTKLSFNQSAKIKTFLDVQISRFYHSETLIGSTIK